MPSPTVTVVIPAYNAASTIGDQLEALINQRDAPPFEVVVANNRSTDATTDIVSSYADQLDVRVVPADGRQGVNFARNAGIAAARGEIVVLLDADDRADPGTVRALTQALESDPLAGIATGVLSMHDPSTFELERPQGYLPYAPGCLMALRKSLFESVGEFDENFVGGHDEVDFCWRVQHAGFRIILARDALLERSERSTARGTFRQFYRYGFTSIQLFAKHRPRGIIQSSLRQELTVFKRVLKELPHLALSGTPRREAACFIGWHLGRWRGDARYRVWGPK